nr:hypothetical protein [Ruminococcus sp.]
MTYLKRICETKKRNRDFFQKNKDYLFPGLYKSYSIDANRFVWKRCDRFSDRFKCYDKEKVPRLKYRVKAFLVSSKRRVKTKTDKSCGSILYISRKENIKVFSQDLKHVYYFINDEDLFNRMIHYNKNYAPYFGDSVIEKIDPQNHKISERFIKEKRNWRFSDEKIRSAAKWLIKCSSSYLNSFDIINRRSFFTFAESVKNKANTAELSTLISKLISKLNGEDFDMPFVYQHNDVVLSNIVKDGKRYTLFDYEFYRKNIFYYDSIMWLVWEAVQYCHDIFLNEFLSGKYDNMYTELFNCAGVEYEP